MTIQVQVCFEDTIWLSIISLLYLNSRPNIFRVRQHHQRQLQPQQQQPLHQLQQQAQQGTVWRQGRAAQCVTQQSQPQ